MIIKDSVFAQAGVMDPEKTSADFRAGMVPNTVAMAEDVNTYGNMSDKDLKVVCDEIVNALVSQGIAPNNSYDAANSTQLRDMLLTKLQGAYSLTGIDYSTYTAAPTQSTNGTSITFTPFDIVFNTEVYYGNTQSQMVRATVAEQTITANQTWEDGVHYIWANRQGGIQHQQTPVLGAEGGTKCMLGSVFVINGVFQSNSWKFQPWLQATTVDRRESPTAYRKGGFISPLSGTQIQMGAVQLLAEGIGFGASPTTPNIMNVLAQAPFTFKLLYPGYNAASPAYTDLTYATTHIYNMSAGETGAWEDIPENMMGKYMCLVPCIVPTGQTLMIPAFTTVNADGTYSGLFDTVEDAQAAIFGLQYSLGRTAERAIYLGQTIIVKAGVTDVTIPTEFITVGIIPEALAGFTSASGQTGGGSGEYVPMREHTVVAADVNYSYTPPTNSSTLIMGDSAATMTIVPPSPQPGIVNQFGIKYTHLDGYKGLSFVNTEWWYNEPVWIANTTYNIILEFVGDKWMGGILQKTASTTENVTE